ncbi:patched domain-containing protein 3-like [Amphiura filiformis]|uniref:patched domain-containing protein 3-like n=1 Tax=Amphiura filiformis TaxID=82378 RepID=UPI003B2250F8
MASCVATMEKPGYFSRCSVSFVSAMENAFYRYGRTVGSHPCVCIIASILLVIVCSSGLANFRRETRTEKLWAPSGSQSLKDLSRVQYYFPPKYRREVLLIEADNVLDPKVLQTMLIIDQRIKNITVRGQPWKSLCYRCSSNCYSSSLLELWSFNATIISRLTQSNIIRKINRRRLISPVYNSQFDLDATLGMIKQNGPEIIGAKATTMTYHIKNIKAGGIKDRITAEKIFGNDLDGVEDEWESVYLNIAKQDYTNITVYRYADKSYTTEASTAIRGDMGFLSGAYIILVVYVMFTASNFSMIEHKVYIAISCILTVGFATLTAIGLTSAFDLAFDNLHSVLPFLLLGIGIDDMFVILASWNNLSHEQKQFQVREQAGLTLRQAGVSIAVTSITDLCAFLIGASTILPSLKSFCIYAAIGVMCLFLFSTTFFMACLTIDRRRYESRRDACCCCYKYRETYKPSEWGQKSVMNEFVRENYAPFLLRLPVKVIVLSITLILLSVCAWGTVTWKQDFDLRRFVLSDSYLISYLDKSQKYFPSKGVETAVYLENVDYFEERDTLNRLYIEIRDDAYIQDRTIQCWYWQFQEWIKTQRRNHIHLDSNNWPTKRSVFDQFLSEFLYSQGQQYMTDIVFKNESTPLPLATRYIRVNHAMLWNTNVEIAAMNSIKLIVSKTPLKNPNAAFVYSEDYIYYEVNTSVLFHSCHRKIRVSCSLQQSHIEETGRLNGVRIIDSL